MEELLLKWNFDELVINNFLEHDVDESQLKDLTPDYIKELVPKIGDRIRFEKFRQEYIRANQDEISPASGIMPNVKKHAKRADVNIYGILSEYSKGRKVLAYFKKENNIAPSHRGHIVHCLVEYFIEAWGSISSDQFENIANKIVAYFPGEDKETYFKRGDFANGKRGHSKGKLVDRYYNLNRNVLSKAKRQAVGESTEATTTTSSAVSTPSTSVSTPSTSVSTPSTVVSPISTTVSVGDELVRLKDILFYQQEETATNILYWKKTFQLRRAEFLSTDETRNIENVVSNWPMITTSFGKKLVELDFEEIYPLKSNGIVDKWPKFIDGLRKLFFEVKDESGLQTVQLLSQGNLSTETYDFYILYLLPYILQPVVRIKSKGKLVKPSITESRDAFIVKINTINNLQVWLDNYTKNQKIRGLTVQPLIIGVGIDDIKEYFVICGEIRYKFSSVVTALRTCFQLHIVLRSAYSSEAIHIWTFIQKFFFSIDTEYDVSLNNVNSLLATLNN